jgi:hypothetical protein
LRESPEMSAADWNGAGLTRATKKPLETSSQEACANKVEG